ncbi:MAG: ParA family protein [Pseudomonadota bacterium]
MLKSVLVTNPKGGCGKTTIATNLAVAFSSAGFPTALADADPQASSLDWLSSRPETAPGIEGLNWSKKIKRPGKKIERLVVDSPAAMDPESLRELVRAVDTVLVPVLPSIFDARATATFLKGFADLKPIRKGKKPFAVLRNRCRTGSRAVKRLDSFVLGINAADVGWLPERSLYNEVAWQGLSVFDLRTKAALDVQRDWIPITRFLEN